MSIFKNVQNNRVKKSAFDLSHERKFSFNMGELIPMLCQEVLPGDKFIDIPEILLRMAPLVAPVMHRVNVYTHFFFVPNRLVWDEWQEFITGGREGVAKPLFPYFEINDDNKARFATGSLADYFGIKTLDPLAPAPAPSARYSALPFRAYNLIYNEYYRDQNLSPERLVNKTSGYDSNEDMFELLFRSWEKDYFTSALPWTQRGPQAVVPITGKAPVVGKNLADMEPGHRYGVFVKAQNHLPPDTTTEILALDNAGISVFGYNNEQAVYDPRGTLEADLSLASSTSINELRKSIRLQEWLEKNARGGARYIEQLLAHFGVRSSDARLQRPEYLGGGKSPIVISEVLQNSATQEDVSPQGNMAGHGISVGSNHAFKKYFEEHGLLIGIISVMPRSAYVDGTPRYFRKFDKFDFAFPEFAQLGEQEVYQSELFDTHILDDQLNVFGYQSRYAEYKYIPSSVHGDFRKVNNGLDKWHMARMFAEAPNLNANFVSSKDITHRVFAVEDPSYQKLYCQLYHNLKAVRPLPYWGTPIM